MKSIREIAFLILAGVMVVGSLEGSVWAGKAPKIEIALRLGKAAYSQGEPVGLEVEVINRDEDLWISEGFSSLVFYREMRVIDPAKRRLLAVRNKDKRYTESPDAPPLPYVLGPKGKLLQVAGCERLPAEWSSGVQRVENLRKYYNLSLPGYYSVRVQVSVMTFKGDLCDINDYAWKGVLRSETKFFYYRATGENTKVIPDQWARRWMDPTEKVPDVQVQIWPLKGESVEDYDVSGIFLNNIAARRVEVQGSNLKAHFDARAVFEKLGNVEVGKSYPAYVSGKRKGVTYYREQEVRVVK